MQVTRVMVTPTTQFAEETPAAGRDELIASLPTFDNTKLVAINTCPLYGIVRYTLHRTMRASGRRMPLEAGGAAHEVFAAHRLYAFREYGSAFYDTTQERVEAAADECGNRIFGKERYGEMLAAVDPREDYRTRCQQFALTALYNCGFYDDPFDKRRTTTNIEEMCIAYMDKYDWKNELPYWDGKNFLGIEVPVDVVISLEYTTDDGSEHVLLVRFIGKADGLHYYDRDKQEVRIHENKTASRLGDAWEMSWETNHQPTGYMIALTAMLQLNITRTVILGTCLPLPKSYSINGLARVVAKREQWQLAEWFQWLLHTVLLHEQYKSNPENAPQYTHSCNRYFSPCQFIPLCATPPDVRRDFIEQMDVDEWSPLHEVEGASDD